MEVPVIDTTDLKTLDEFWMMAKNQQFVDANRFFVARYPNLSNSHNDINKNIFDKMNQIIGIFAQKGIIERIIGGPRANEWKISDYGQSFHGFVWEADQEKKKEREIQLRGREVAAKEDQNRIEQEKLTHLKNIPESIDKIPDEITALKDKIDEIKNDREKSTKAQSIVNKRTRNTQLIFWIIQAIYFLLMIMIGSGLLKINNQSSTQKEINDKTEDGEKKTYLQKPDSSKSIPMLKQLSK